MINPVKSFLTHGPLGVTRKAWDSCVAYCHFKKKLSNRNFKSDEST